MSGGSRGVTVIELLLAIAVASILIIALTMFVGRSFNISREQFEQVRITEDARLEMERMSDTIRNARNLELNNTTYRDIPQERWLQEAKKYSVTIYSNIDEDTTSEQIRYYVNPDETDLWQEVTQLDDQGNKGIVTRQVLIRSVRNHPADAAQGTPLFTFYTFGAGYEALPLTSDTVGLTAANLDRVSRVGLRLIIDITEQQLPSAVNLRTDVTPRITDCASSVCQTSSTTTACNDTADNDGDGLKDAFDPGCWSASTDAATYDATRNNEAAATTQCQDSVSNSDSDTAYDFTGPQPDPGCVNVADNDEWDFDNDNFNGVRTLTLPFTTQLNINTATTESSEPLPCFSLGKTAWYRYLSSADPAQLTISTINSNFNAVIAVYKLGNGNGFPALEPVTCSGATTVDVNTDPNTTYYIQAGGQNGETGNLKLDVR